jgi:FkbM family methyltransferase
MSGDGMRPRLGEPADVRLIRCGFQWWPFRRGKGLLLRLVRPWLAHRHFVFEIEPGIVLQPEFDDRILYWAFVDGRSGWDPIMDLSRALIGTGDVVFDVGANVGVWLLGAARRAGETGSVHAFEPVPENLARLRTHLSLNALDFVHVDPRVLSSEPGEVPFFPSRTSNSGMGSLGPSPSSAEPVRVTATTLDLYCQEHGIGHVDFLKVDVEGAELLVFRGGARLLAAVNAPAIMFEADDSLAAGLSSSTAATKEFLAYCGYRAFHFTGTRLEPIAPSATHTNHDLLALKRHHFERHQLLRRYV